jgi:hypothetical protein
LEARRVIHLDLDPMATLQLVLGVTKELHVQFIDTEIVVTMSTTFKGNEEIISVLRQCYENLRPDYRTKGVHQ